MTVLSPLDRLQAAIEKLERLKTESAPGPWSVDVWRGYTIITSSKNDMIADRISMPIEAEMLVTLHRTIDAQLEILRDAREHFADRPDLYKPGHLDKFHANDIALADAILGGDS